MVKEGIFYFLSILLAIILMSLAQEVSFLELSIFRDIIHLLVFFLFTLLITNRFAIVGVSSVSVILVVILLLQIEDKNAIIEIVPRICFMIIGALLALFLKSKSTKSFGFTLLFSCLLVSYLAVSVYPEFSTLPSAGETISQLNQSKQFLIGHSNENPCFNRDTVYLVNFSFLNCAPCRMKKQFLTKLDAEFDGKAYKRIEIHSFEDKKIFDEQYMLEFPLVYHDSSGRVSRLFKISGGPEEIIFNKQGKSVRRFVGFSKDISVGYMRETSRLIERLLNE